MTIDLNILEAAIKLAAKYQLEELTLPDGTRIVKKIHLGKPMPKKKEVVLPISTFDKEQALFLSTPAPPIDPTKFNRHGVSVKGS